jgi:glycosyltransferase involved in cell wall biosynthesis
LLDQTAEQEGVERVAIRIRRNIAPAHDLISLIRLCRLLHRLRPVLTEFSTPKAGLLGNLAAMMCRVPTRIYLLRGLRLETEVGFKRILLQFIERVSAACAHRVICNSESLLEQALALGVAKAPKLDLLGRGSSNGVDVDRFAPGPSIIRRRLGFAYGTPVIGFVGRLTRDKGVPELLEAFEEVLRSLPNARLLLVGWYDQSADALSPVLRQFIDSHPRISRTGFVPDTAPYYKAMDVLVLPTWREGFPNVVLEAAASGIPVITTFATGARDAVIPEVTGLLIPPGYPEAICEATLKILQDTPLRRRMGVAARERVLDQFVDDRVLGLSVALYQSLVRANALTGDGLSTAVVEG